MNLYLHLAVNNKIILRYYYAQVFEFPYCGFAISLDFASHFPKTIPSDPLNRMRVFLEENISNGRASHEIP